MPTSQAGGNSETSSTARLPSSSLRCTSMTLRMYAASRSPRRVDDRLPDRVELDAELLDVLGRQVGDRVVGPSSAGRSWCLLPVVEVEVEVGQWSMSQAPAAAETQVWIEHAVAGRRRW